ncbi:MAG TPA: FecR family protein [Planctomycetota bacterium]|nr:FecR family protein [Planctomycetota bacterium]
MESEELERLMIDYLHQRLQPQDRIRLQQHLNAHPAAAAKILELADEELLLSRGLKALPLVSHISQRVSRRVSQRRLLRRENNSALVWTAFGIAALVALCLLLVNSWHGAPAAEAVATLESASGDTVLVRAGKTARVQNGDSLALGDELKTAHSEARVRYADGTTLQLGASSVVQFKSASGGKKVMLHTGSLQCRAASQPAGQPLVIYTKEAETTVIGTVFKLLSQSGITRLQVDEGKVKLTDVNTRESATISSGEFVVADNRRKLAVTKIETPAVAAIPDTFTQEFPDKSSFKEGILDLTDVPPGMVASVRQVPIPNSDKLFIMSSLFTETKPYFMVHDDSVIHLTYRSEIVQGFSTFELFLVLFPADGWSYSKNIICRVTPTSTAWQTVEIPISKFLDSRTAASQKVEGMVCRCFFLQTYNYSGIRVGRFSVTREKAK